MKNQILFKQIDDPEAVITCEYMIQDGVVGCGQRQLVHMSTMIDINHDCLLNVMQMVLHGESSDG